jgi:hypothetical protein
MPFAQMREPAGEVLERGGPRQFKDGCAEFEHGHHASLRRVADMRILHDISLLRPSLPINLGGVAEVATIIDSGIFW